MAQKSAPKPDNPVKSKIFIEMARRLGADQNDEALQRALRLIAAKRSAPKQNRVVESFRLDIPSSFEKAFQKMEVNHPQTLTIPKLAFGSETPRHVIATETRYHPRGTIYRIVELKGPTYAVQVTKPCIPPTTMCGFRTEAEAEAWVKVEKLKTKQAEKG